MIETASFHTKGTCKWGYLNLSLLKAHENLNASKEALKFKFLEMYNLFCAIIPKKYMVKQFLYSSL